MNICDALVISISKIMTRKLRTIVSIISISVLFGVIIAAILIISGLRSSLEASADTLFNGDIYLRASQSVSGFDDQETINRAIDLYQASVDPNKQYPLVTTYPSGETLDNPYLDKNNVFAVQAAGESRKVIQAELEEKIKNKTLGYDVAVSPMAEYTVRADSMHIENNHTLPNTGGTLLSLPHEIIQSLIQVSAPDTDSIPIIMPMDIAGQIAGIGSLSHSASNEQRKAYVAEVNKKAIGFKYSATLQRESAELEVPYQIVGLLPPLGSLRLAKKNNDFNVLDLIIGSLGADTPPFIAIDTSSQLFQETYTSGDVYSIRADYLLKFTDVRQAATFQREYSCSIAENHCQDFFVGEILNNHLSLHEALNSVDGLLSMFVVFFSMIAVIIMVSTLSRILDDERQSIALYRAAGASTAGIIQIYAGYIAMLCLFACIAAFIIGISLSGFAAILAGSDLSSNVAYFYGISETIRVTLIRFDPRIWLIVAIIFVVGVLCFLLLSDKLTSKNIVKSLKD